MYLAGYEWRVRYRACVWSMRERANSAMVRTLMVCRRTCRGQVGWRGSFPGCRPAVLLTHAACCHCLPCGWPRPPHPTLGRFGPKHHRPTSSAAIPVGRSSQLTLLHRPKLALSSMLHPISHVTVHIDVVQWPVILTSDRCTYTFPCFPCVVLWFFLYVASCHGTTNGCPTLIVGQPSTAKQATRRMSPLPGHTEHQHESYDDLAVLALEPTSNVGRATVALP